MTCSYLRRHTFGVYRHSSAIAFLRQYFYCSAYVPQMCSFLCPYGSLSVTHTPIPSTQTLPQRSLALFVCPYLVPTDWPTVQCVHCITPYLVLGMVIVSNQQLNLVTSERWTSPVAAHFYGQIFPLGRDNVVLRLSAG